ncbi:hypothetical protein [Cetobacterium somerae]
MALIGIWKQIENDKKEGILKYFKYVLELNLNDIFNDEKRRYIYPLISSSPRGTLKIRYSIKSFSNEIINSNIDKVFVLNNVDKILKMKMNLDFYINSLDILNQNIQQKNKNFKNLIDISNEIDDIKKLFYFISILSLLLKNYSLKRTPTTLLISKNRLVLLAKSSDYISDNLSGEFKKFLFDENSLINWNYSTLHLIALTLYEVTEYLSFHGYGDEAQLFEEIATFSTQEKYILDQTEKLKANIEDLILEIDNELVALNK